MIVKKNDKDNIYICLVGYLAIINMLLKNTIIKINK